MLSDIARRDHQGHKMLKLESVKTDIRKEREGDWIDFPDWPGVSFQVKSVESPDFKMARDMLLRKLARKHKGKPIPTDELQIEVGKLYSKHILLGWKGLDVSYSDDAASDVLTDPAYRKVFAAIEWCATQVGENDADFVEDAAKNSEPRSGTS